MPQTTHLVNAGRSLPIDNVNQVPRIPNEIHLQLALPIDHDLGCRVQDARALALVRVVYVELASGQVVGGRSGVPVDLTESEEPVSDKANLPSLSSVTFTSRCGFLGHFRAAAPKDHENS